MSHYEDASADAVLTRRHGYSCAFYTPAAKTPDEYKTLGDLVAAMFLLREVKEGYSSWADEQATLAANDYRALEVALYNRMQSEGIEKVPTAVGTASLSLNATPAVQKDSWPEFYEYVYAEKRGDLLHKRLTAAVAKKLHEDGVVIPGVSWTQEVAISLRKKTGT